MSKKLVMSVLVLLLVGVIVLSGVRAQDCKETTATGYSRTSYSCSGAGCTGTCSQISRECSSSSSGSCTTYSTAYVKWEYDNTRCKRDFTCSDDQYNSSYRCNGDVSQRGWVDYSCGSTVGSCPIDYSWKDVETCTYGCTGAGVCNTVDVSLCANGGTVCSAGLVCQNSVCVSNTNLNTTYWANMNGQNVSNASLGDTVLMIYGGYGLTGKSVNYTVQEFNDSSVWWNPFTWFNKDWNSANKISGNAYQPLLITNDDKKKFIATAGSVSNTSGNLTITAEDNSDPTWGDILSPFNLANVSVNASTLFRRSVLDEDDLLKITWDFGDGASATFYNYSYYVNSTSSDVRHNYTKSGVYYWTITAEEMGRTNPNKISETRAIYVLQNGINVIPEISSPPRGSVVGTAWTTFNASKTFVANCTSGVMANRNIITSDNLLNCSYLHAPGSRIYQNLSGYYLTFNWNMGDGKTIVKNWTAADYNSSIEFFYKYDSSGTHYITLGVDYGLK